VISCEIRPCVYSDHEFVFLELNLHSANNWGLGVWKFNNTLLQEDKFCASIRDLIDIFLSLRSSFSSDLVMWDLLKYEIKTFAIRYSRENWGQLSREKNSAINCLSLLKCRLAPGCESVKPEILQLELSLRQLLEKQLEGSKIRSRVKWLEEGEAPSRFFLRSENERHAKAFVLSIYDLSGTEVFSLPEIINAHAIFYTELFSCGNVNLNSQQNPFSYVTAPLSDSHRASCEGPLSLAEATEALCRANRNKSPGAEELSVEFFSHFWDSLGELLVVRVC